MGETFPPFWFVIAGSVIVVGWMLFELWLRTAPLTEVQVIKTRERGSSEGSSYQARVSIPSGNRVDQKWVWVSHSQFQTLHEKSEITVHLRQIGETTLVRGVRHQALVWVLGVIAIYLMSSLVIQLTDL